jgi:hypothetical protein
MTKYYVLNGIPQMFEYSNEEEGINLALYPNAISITEEDYNSYISQVESANDLQVAKREKEIALNTELQTRISNGYADEIVGQTFGITPDDMQKWTALASFLSLGIPDDESDSVKNINGEYITPMTVANLKALLIRIGMYWRTVVYGFETDVVPAKRIAINACETVEEVNAITW